jgi:hypothetical protein
MIGELDFLCRTVVAEQEPQRDSMYTAVQKVAFNFMTPWFSFHIEILYRGNFKCHCLFFEVGY